MELELKDIDEMIDYLFSIRSQLLAELGVKEIGGWTDEEFELASKGYAEASKNFKFVA